jgi:Short C-terminal domain
MPRITRDCTDFEFSGEYNPPMAKVPVTVVMVTALAVAYLAAACANPGIVQLSPDTYMLSRTDKGGVFGNSAAMKAGVISDANAFAQSKGKVVIPLTTHETPMEVGRGLATFDYQFKLVDPNSPEARSTVLMQRPDVVIEKNEKSNVDVRVKDTSDKPKDLYSELLKLDDLHKKGILSDQEFDAQKKKLLSEN